MRKSVPWVAIAALFLPATAFGELTIPPPIHAQAEGPNGAYVGFTITVVGGNDGSDGRPADTVTCSPASNSLFPLGTTTVTCSGSEGSTGSFTVTVVDTIAPTLTLPRDFTVVATSPAGASVTWVATASDIVDVTVPVACTPASGTSFPLGTTTVTCSATDSHGNTASGQFAVTVATSPPPPGNPDIVAEATGPDGARVTFDTGDADDGDGRPGSGGCAPAPGSLFPLGNTLDDLLMKITLRRWARKKALHQINANGNRMGIDGGRHYAKPDPETFQNNFMATYEHKVLRVLTQSQKQLKPVS